MHSGFWRAGDGTGPSTETLRYLSARSNSYSEKTVNARLHSIRLAVLRSGLAVQKSWLLILASLTIALPTPLHAHDEASPGGVGRPPSGDSLPGDTGGAWRPPLPAAGKAEWIRLKSGEWLRGEIKVMRDGDLEFESDELNDLTFDWEDVWEVFSPSRNSYGFENRRVAVGTAVINREEVVVATEEGEERFPREKLLSIIPGDDFNFWTAKVSLGLTARAGNTEQTEFTASAFARRESELTRMRFDYNGAIGTIDGDLNVNNHRANAKIDVYLTRRLYVTPASFEFFEDKFQNIDSRMTPGIGVGYHVLKRKRVDWDLELGASYQRTTHVSVTAGDDLVTNEGVILVSSILETEVTSVVDFDLSYTLQLGVPTIANTTHHAQVMFAVEITKVIDLDVKLIWDRVESPTESADGVIPNKNDLRLTVGFGLEY